MFKENFSWSRTRCFKDTGSGYYSVFCPRIVSEEYTFLRSSYAVNYLNVDSKVIADLKGSSLYSHVYNTAFALENKDELIFGTDSLAAVIPSMSKKKNPQWEKDLIDLRRISGTPRASAFRDKQLYDLLIDNSIDLNDNHPVQFAYKSQRDADSGLVVACPFINNQQNHSAEVPGLRIQRDFKLPADSSFLKTIIREKHFYR